MKLAKIISGSLAWIVCGVFAYGLLLGQFRYLFEGYETDSCREDQGVVAVISLTGPLALVAGLLVSGVDAHGMRWSCKGDEPKAAR